MQVVFGEFTLDIGARQLWKGGERRHLSPKALQLLYLLIENRPDAVSKTMVHDRLWPSTFVSDGTVTSLVAELRAVLDETARAGRFVRTVHGFGYAFSGEVADREARLPDQRARCWVIWEWGQLALTDGVHVLGRDRDAAVWLESPTVSRHHARIRVAGREAVIEDLASKNGSFVDGERVTAPVSLNERHEIRLGSVVLTFRCVDADDSTVTRNPRDARTLAS